jgi:hypothetical protein
MALPFGLSSSQALRETLISYMPSLHPWLQLTSYGPESSLRQRLLVNRCSSTGLPIICHCLRRSSKEPLPASATDRNIVCLARCCGYVHYVGGTCREFCQRIGSEVTVSSGEKAEFWKGCMSWHTLANYRGCFHANSALQNKRFQTKHARTW